jgi:hypothetical protein
VILPTDVLCIVNDQDGWPIMAICEPCMHELVGMGFARIDGYLPPAGR